MSNAPIVFFAYNRLEHTRRSLESLARCEGAAESELFIYCDGPKKREDEPLVKEVSNLVKSRKWCGKVNIIERNDNWGLAKSIINGVTDIVNKYGRVIVVEDDLICHPQLLSFLNEALEKYQSCPRVFSITGFNYPKRLLGFPKDYVSTTYFNYRAHTWSWATWKDRWGKVDFKVSSFDKFNQDKESQTLFNRGGDDLTPMLRSQMEGKIDSWGIRFCFAQFKNGGYTLYPVDSLVQNIGFDGSGTHCGKSDWLSEEVKSGDFKFIYPSDIDVDFEISLSFKKIFRSSFKLRLKNKLKELILRKGR